MGNASIQTVEVHNCELSPEIQEKRSSPSTWTDNTSIQTKNCVAAFSVMAAIVFSFLVRKYGHPCRLKLDIWKFVLGSAGRTKCSAGP